MGCAGFLLWQRARSRSKPAQPCPIIVTFIVTFGRFGPFTKETEGVGFEPTVGCPTLDFESSALNRTQPPFPFCKIDILLIDSEKSAFIMRRARPFANPPQALEPLRARDALD